MEKVTINSKEYYFKPSNYALGVTLKRQGVSLSDLNKSFADIDFLYEYIYQTVKFCYSVLDKKPPFGNNKFKFFAELDADQDALQSCMEIINESYDTGEEGDETKKKEVEA